MTRTAPARPRSSSRSGALLALLSATALVAGCSGSSSTSPSQAGTGTAGAHDGGTLTIDVASDQGCVDPQQVSSNDSIYSSRQLVDSLTDQDPETGDVVPWLATSWDVSPDATSYTFHLRQGATFSDGTPVDAAAVQANLDAVRGLGPRAALPISYLTGYTGTEVVDPLTARVSFSAPNAQFLQATATHSLGLVSVATTRQTADQRCTSVVGSGPFTLESYTRGSTVALARRDGYAWGSSLWKSRGAAHLDRVVFQVVPESGVRTGSLQSGQADAIASVGPQDEQPLQAAGVRLQARANPGVVFELGLNNARPLLADPAVRRAVSLAIDREEVVATALTSQSRPATSILASSTPGYSDLSSTLRFDRKASAAALRADGWAKGGDGIYAKGGQRLAFTIEWANNLATNETVLQLVQQQLKDAGIAVELEQHPIGDFAAIQQAGSFDALWINTTRADPDILRQFFSTQAANTYRLPPSPLDALLAQQAATADPAARQDLVARAQEAVVDNAYGVPVVELTTVLGVGAHVHDLAFDASSRIQLHDTWKS